MRPITVLLSLLFTMNSLPAATPLIIAHRGASFDAPENTLACYRLGWEQGADGIEGDFRLTLDGRIVASHDASTKRTGDRDLEVWKSTFDELQAVDAGSWKDKRFAGEKMPSIEQVLAVVKPGGRIYVEIYNPFTVAPLRRAVDASGLKPEQVTVISFNQDSVAAARKLMPACTAYWIVSLKPRNGALAPTAAEILQVLRATGANGVDVSAEKELDAAFVSTIRNAGFSFHVWTVNDPADARRLAALGVDSITTDKPRVIREAVTHP